MNHCPFRLGLRFFQFGPMPVRFQSPLKHEFRLVFLGRNQANDIFIQTRRYGVRIDISEEAVLVLAPGEILDRIHFCFHYLKFLIKPCTTRRSRRLFLHSDSETRIPIASARLCSRAPYRSDKASSSCPPKPSRRLSRRLYRSVWEHRSRPYTVSPSNRPRLLSLSMPDLSGSRQRPIL